MNEALRYPPLTEKLKSLSFLTLLRFFGPGAIIASVTIGSGETVFENPVKSTYIDRGNLYLNNMSQYRVKPQDGLLVIFPSFFIK